MLGSIASRGFGFGAGVRAAAIAAPVSSQQSFERVARAVGPIDGPGPQPMRDVEVEQDLQIGLPAEFIQHEGGIAPLDVVGACAAFGFTALGFGQANHDPLAARLARRIG